jgi:Fe-S-cluster-containing dehydrogenase component
MARYGMIIDVDRCNGCYNCFLACKDEYDGNDYPPISFAQASSGKSWMQIIEKERGSWPKVKMEFIPLPCLHCEEALCVKKASDGEVYRRPDGIVLIDPEKSKGKKDIVSTCPYRVISWNEEKNIPQKCTFCAHLLDEGWKEPRCVEACPSGALVFGDLDDPESEISRKIGSGDTEEFHPEYGLKPSVHYMNLPKRFIAGEILLKDRQDQCAEGVTVVLKDGGGDHVCKTDFLGDFEFEGLESSRSYTLVVEHAGYEKRELSLKPGRDVNLGEIVLEPKG